MKKSKIMILLLAIVMILAVSAVSAADTNDTSDSDLQAVDEAPVDEVASPDVDKLESTDSSNVLSTGERNFTELQDAISNPPESKVITLNSSYTRVGNEGEIVIGDSIVINGNGYTIDGNNTGGIFRINYGAIVMLNNVILINGNGENGGAIYNEGTLIIKNCQFSNNNASLGGAIYNNGILDLSGSTFANNNATNGLSIYNNRNMSLDRNTINGPIVTTAEGIITSDIKVTVLDNDVKRVKDITVILDAYITDDNNNVINQIGDLFKFTVDDVDVGAAVYNSQLQNYQLMYTLTAPGIYTVNVTYAGNKLKNISSKQKNLINYRGTYTDLQEMINANTTIVLPYDITYNDVVDADNFPSGVVINKTITINGNGHTISGNNDHRIFNVTAKDVALNNVALEKGNAATGGAIYVGNGASLTTTATFTNNTATKGRAIYVVGGGNLTVTGATFNEDGAVYIDRLANAEISSSRFTSDEINAIYNLGTLSLSGNTVKTIYNGGNITSPIKVLVLNGQNTVYADSSNFRLYANITDDNYNPIKIESGFEFIIYNENVNVVKTAFFNQNTLLYEAEYTFPSFGYYKVNMTYAETASNMEIINGTITYIAGTFTDLQRLIREKNEGDTLELPYKFTYDAQFDAQITEIVIDKIITIDGKGYTISGNDLVRIFNVTNGATLTLTNATLTKGKANNGSAIYSEGDLVLNGVTFSENVAVDCGGAIYSKQGNVKIEDCVFDKNDLTNRADGYDKGYGGAAIYSIGGTLNIDGSKFTNNLLNYNPGAGGQNRDLIQAVIVSSGVTVINNTAFENNSGCYGADINVYKSSTIADPASLSIDNSNFTNSKSYAGAIQVSKIDFTITNSNFNNCIAYGIGSTGYTASGGAIYATNCNNAVIKDSNFTKCGNTQGGAIDIERTKSLLIDGCIFEDNTVSGTGGAVAIVQSAGDVNITNTDFISNEAGTAAGAVYYWTIADNKLTISNCEFEDNTAGTNGGAVYAIMNPEGSVDISNSNFTSNVASGDGGAVFFKTTGSDNKLTISGSNFTGNDATNGEAVYTFKNTVAEITGSTFTDNGGTADYAIYNDGTLSLDNNVISNFIYNGGKITSQVIATILDNGTYETKEDTYTLNATLTDRNGNLINDSSLRFVVNSDPVTDAPAFDAATGLYTYANYPITLDSGVYRVAVKLDNVTDLVINIGVIKNLKVGTFTDLKQKIETANNGDLILKYNFTYNADIDKDLKVINITNPITIDGKGHTISGNGEADIFIINADVKIKNTIFTNVASYAIDNNDTLELTNNTISVDNALIRNNGNITNAVVEVLAGETITIKYHQDVTLNATFKDDKGNLIEDSRFAFTVEDYGYLIPATSYANGVYSAGYTANNVGTKIVNVSNIGTPTVNVGKLNIKKAEIKINITANDTIERKQNESIKITLEDEYGYSVVAKLEVFIKDSTGTKVDPTYEPTTTGGVWSIEVPGLGVDNYTINVVFPTNDYYTSNSAEKRFEVVQLNITNTFTELQELIQAKEGTEEVLVLPHDFKYDDYVDEDLYADGVLISKNITIDGNGTTIDADKFFRLLNIADGITVTIANVTFINGNATAGAAILTKAASLTIDSCKFLNNDPVNGGAIYIEAGNVTVIGATLYENNTADNGGAIYVAAGGTLTVNGATFNNNTAAAGGAIYVEDGGIVTLNGTTFTNNVDNDNYTVYNLGTLALYSNSVDKIIYNGGKITTPVYSTVLGNTTYNIENPTVVLAAGLLDDENGNKIYDPNFMFVANGQTIVNISYNATTGIYNATLDINPAVRAYVVNVTSANEEKLITKISIFQNITGTFTELQGLINSTDAGATLVLPYDFAYVATVDGDKFPQGVVINKAITIDGNGSTISGSNSKRIFRVTAATTLNNISLVEGNAIEFGGAIYATANLNVYNSTFDHNAVSQNDANGGAIMVEASTDDLTLNIKNVDFTYNMVDNGGAAIAVAGVSGHQVVYNIYDSLFENNVAITTGDVNAAGAAIFSYANAKGLINNTIFRGNKAETGEFATGGAIKIQFGGTLTVANSTFDSNVANRSGGAISIQAYNDQSRLTVNNCTFTNNAANDGSAISSASHYDSTYVTIIGSNFNEANAVSLDIHTTARISDSVFTSTEKYAIYNLGTLELAGNTVEVIFNNGTITTQTNSTVLENKTYDITRTSTYYIKADLVDDSNNKIYDPNFRFVINRVTNAAVPDYDPATGVYNITLDTTTERVYVVDVASANEDILSTKISIVREITGTFTDLQRLINDTPAGDSLNLPYDFTYTPEIDDGSFDEGVLISSPININGKGFTITGNNTRIFNVTAKDVILNNVTLVNGSAVDGGAIYVADGGDLQVKASTFENNIADHGAIYVADGGKLTVTGTTFNEDRAICNNGTASISNSVFTSEEIYAIYNLGDLKLSGNKVKLIFNNGNITSTVIATFIGGQTIPAALDDVVTPNATLTDDSLNPIYDGRFNITVRGNEVQTDYNASTYLYFGEYKIVNAGINTVSTKYPATITPGIYDVPKANVTNFTIEVLPYIVPYEGNATAFITLLGVNGEKLDVTGMIVVVNNTEKYVDIVEGEGSLNISGLAPGNYAALAIFDGNDNYNGAYATAVFDVLEQDAILSVEVEDIHFGDMAYVNITLTFADGTPAIGNVFLEVNGVQVIVIVDGNESVGFADVPVGKYNVTAVLLPDGLYGEVVNDTESFEVFDSHEVNVPVDADETITYGDNLTVEIGQIISKGTNATITGNATISIYVVDDYTEPVMTITDINVTGEGAIVGDIAGLDVGSYVILVEFDSADRYYAGVNATGVTVTKAKVGRFIINTTDAVYGDQAVINITIKGANDENLNGTLYITINGEPYELNVTMTDGNYVSYVPADYGVGTYTVNVYFEEAYGNYEDDLTYEAFEITKATPTIVVDNATSEWDETVEIPVKLIGANGAPIVGTVTVQINWVEDGKYDVVELNESGEGVAVFRISEALGELDIIVTFEGNDNYTSAQANATLTITESLTPELVLVADSTVSYGETVYVNATLKNAMGTELANATLTYRVDDGVNKTIQTDKNGFVSIPIDDLAGGEHIIFVSFNNESYHDVPFIQNVTVKVTPIEPTFKVNVSESNVYGNNVTITVTSELIGNVTLYINNKEVQVEVPLEDGNYTFEVPGLAAGTNTGIVLFNGNENYTEAGSFGSFEVAKATPVLDVNDTVVVYNETNVIPFAVIGVNGQYVNGSVYAIQFETEEYGAVLYFDDGTGEITFRDLATGVQLITVKFASENDNYTNVVKDIYLNVTQATITNLSAANERDFTYREPINITVYVEGLVGDDDIEVCLNITDINGISVFEDYFTVADGDVITVSEILPVGEYNYDITFAGDDTYVPGEKGGLVSGVFYVDPINITDIVTIDGSEITYGENGTITVSDIPEDAKGNITITLIGVNGKFIADVEDGYAVVEIPGLNGNHIYYVESIVYSGDEIYAPFTIEDDNIAIEVERASSEIYILPVSDTTHLGNTSFTFFVVNATTVFVRVVSSEREIIYEENITEIPANGIVYKTVNLTNVPAGKYTILVFNNLTDNYKSAFEYVSFVSERISPEMETSITPDIKVEDEGVQISITLPVDANGTVSVLIDGNVISLGGKQTDGNLTVNVPADKLTFGPHSYTVQFSGDSYYLAEDVTLPFSVTKIDQPVSVIIDEEEIGFMGSPVVNISVASDATGRIFIDVNGEYTVFENLTEGGNYTIQIVDLQAGEFYLNVTYMGDRKYNEANNYTTFTVPKAVAAVNITDNPTFITYGDDLTFTVTMTNNFATGNVTIFINDVANATIFLDEDDANASVAISGLAVDNYEIGVKYNGNDNFVESDTVKFLLSVNKADSSVVIDSIGNQTYGSDVVITYSVVNRTNVTVTFAIYNGTGFEDINASNELFEDHIVVHDLASAIYIVYINNNESESYRHSEASMVFVVNPAEPVINITVETAYYTSDVNVSYSIDPAFLGYEIFVYDDNATLISHTDVDNTIVLSNLTTGYYNITVYAYYNENYTDGYSTARFYVSIMDINPPANTSDTVFTITMPENATGLLLVDIDGQHYFAPLENGTASITVPQLVPGNYTANVTYTGDENYPGFSTTQNVTVESNVPDNAFTIPDSAKSDAPTTYSIKLDENATGYLEVDVDGTKYVGALNKGQASVTIPALSAGDHNVTVTYNGDKKHTPVVKETKLSVTEPVFKITNNKNVAAVYSAKANYKVRVLREGKAVGAGVTVTFKFNGKTYTAKTDAKGYATLKLNTKVKVGKYTITATYKGVTVKNTVTIKQLIKAKKAKIKKSKKVNKIKVKTKKVNGKYLKGKKLKLMITKASKSKKKSSSKSSASSSAKKSSSKAKVKYIKAKINKKGVAIFKLKKSVTKKLKAGKKYKYTVIYGKDTITKKLTVKK